MKNSMSKTMIETIVRKTIKDIKESPERSTRNLVDMALQFSEGRFQQYFFSNIQGMLQNEDSAYYRMIYDLVSHTDTEYLLKFGMNLGYNSFTAGAKTIRKKEQEMNCNIPWMVSVTITKDVTEAFEDKYAQKIEEGKQLGIYSWAIFAEEMSEGVLSLIRKNSDCAFFLFCFPEDINEELLDKTAELKNMMLVVQYREETAELYRLLRKNSIPFSLFYLYDKEDKNELQSGDIFYEMQQFHPVFSVLAAKRTCSEEMREFAYEEVKKARLSQEYVTVFVEFDGDNRMIDRIISVDDCAAAFDKNGSLLGGNEKAACLNFFTHSLEQIFLEAFPK